MFLQKFLICPTKFLVHLIQHFVYFYYFSGHSSLSPLPLLNMQRLILFPETMLTVDLTLFPANYERFCRLTFFQDFFF